MEPALKPFVKWAGGKRQLLDRLSERVPKSYNRYYEPFIGSGALLLALQPTSAVINDVNAQLLNVYKQLKIDANEVIHIVSSFDENECNQDMYLLMRQRYNDKISQNILDAECAALTIWINKHCFNGLYRVNSKGLFNVPYNNKVSGSSIDEANLRAIGNYLNKNLVEIRHTDFEVACSDVKRGDFIYFDSPYIPVSATANFTDYTKDGFTLEDHKRLAEFFRRLHERGAYLMLSNNDVPLVHELYASFNIEKIDVLRNINRNAAKRKGQEVIIRNY